MILLGPELLTNGGFESDPVDPSPWYKGFSQSSAYVSDIYPYAGDNCLWFETFSTGGAVWNHNLISNSLTSIITSGESYRMNAAVTADTDLIFDLRVYGDSFYDGASLNAGGYTENSLQVWTFYSWDFESIETINPNIKIRLSKDTDPHLFLFDAMSLRRYVNAPAGYDYKNIHTLDRVLARSARGGLRTYTGPGDYRRFEAPVSWVSRLDASTVNSWWLTGTEIMLIENDDHPNSYYNVRIIGDKQPLNQYQRPHFGEYLNGDLTMETV